MNKRGQILGRGITLFMVIIVVFLIMVGFLVMTYFISLGKSSNEIFNVNSFNGASVFLLVEHVNNEEMGKINLIDSITIGDSKIGDYLLEYSKKNDKCSGLVVEDVSGKLGILYNYGVFKNVNNELELTGFNSAPLYETTDIDFIVSEISFIGSDDKQNNFVIYHYVGECKNE